MTGACRRHYWDTAASTLAIPVAGHHYRLAGGSPVRAITAALAGGDAWAFAAYAIAGLTGYRHPLQNAYERPVGVLCGMVNGALTGMTGSFVFSGVMFLHALRLYRHQLVQSVGILFTLSTLALQGHGRLTPSLGLSSTLGLLPALIGMLIGSHIRHLLTDTPFAGSFSPLFWALDLSL